MNSKILPTIIVNLLLTMVWCECYPDGVNLINELNHFYRFNHHFFFMDSTIDLNRWFPMSSPSLGTKFDIFASQSVYTFDGRSDDAFNITGLELMKNITNRNAFLVVVAERLKIENGSQLMDCVKAIRQFDINVKIGVFLARKIKSLDALKQLFRWSQSAHIVNIFGAFHLSVDNGAPSFNVFNYNPFGTMDLINVTGRKSIQEYFPAEIPNYRKHPIRFVVVREIDTNDNEMKFWDTVLRVFNASMSKIYVDYAELNGIPGDIFVHEVNVEMFDALEQLYSYPHRQKMVVMVVPHAQPYSDFVAYLQNGTWTLLFIYAFIVISTSSLLLFVSGYLQKRSVILFQCVADVTNLLMNDNAAIKYGKLHRADVLVTVPFTFTGLIVMNGIVSVFQSYITAPIYQPQINTLKDLYTSTVPILAVEIEWKDKLVELLKDLSTYTGWSDKVHGTNIDQLSKEVAAFNNSIAFFTLDENMQIYLEVQKRLALKVHHVLDDVILARYLVSYKFSSEFPFDALINNVVHRLNGAGLIDKWFRDENEANEKEIWKRNRDLRFNISNESEISQFSVPTVVWCGWIVGTIVFICEIMWNKIESYQRMRKTKVLSFKTLRKLN